MTKNQQRALSEQVRQAIARSELSPSEIAKNSGVHKSALSRFMSGERGLSFEALEKIAPLLGLQITTKKKTAR